jgi:hypothetical protein
MLNPEAATGHASAPAGRIASFGKYLLLQRVSVGGMAEVFKAIPEGATRIDQIIAIKRILPNIAEDHEFIGMFVDEARLVGQLAHPNICRIYELGRVGGDHYIAMQFLWGRDLLKVMNRYKKAGMLAPEPMAVFVAANACAALHYAHNKCDASGAPLHIIHRDVSPQNIIVGYAGQSKLIDFGVARAATQSQKTQAGILKGKFGYMSPEMIRGLPVDHRSDVFAMGICLHEALTGSRLFYGETDFATLELVRDARVVPPSTKVPTVHPELDAIVMRALTRDAEQRYQTAQQLEDALLGFLDAHYPGYGEAQVGACMREAFGHELTREKLRLDAFSRMLERGELVRGAILPALPVEPPPSGERNAAALDEAAGARAAEKVSQSQPGFDERPFATGKQPELREEQTHIFFSAAELSEIRQLEPLDAELSNWWTNSRSADAAQPAPSRPKLTPSGTYPRRFDEHGRAAHTPAPQGRRRDERGVPAQTLRASESSSRAYRARDMRGRGLVRASLLALSALALAVFGYGAVRLGAHRTATLEIGAVDDPDALVRVDGIVRGNPPLIVEGLAPGSHSLELEARGFELARANIRVEAGETRAVDLMLSPKLTPTTTSTETTPSVLQEGAQRAGEPSGSREADRAPSRAQPRARSGLAAGAKSARPPEPAETDEAQALAPSVSPDPAPPQNEAASGSDGPRSGAAPEPDAERTVHESQPVAGQAADAVNADAAAAGQGELLISTVPWSRVIIDGNDTGRDTPVRALRVAVGPHRVVLRTPDGPEHEVSVMVLPGKTIRIIHRFPETL